MSVLLARPSEHSAQSQLLRSVGLMACVARRTCRRVHGLGWRHAAVIPTTIAAPCRSTIFADTNGTCVPVAGADCGMPTDGSDPADDSDLWNLIG